MKQVKMSRLRQLLLVIPKDFKKGTLPVYSPEELLKKLDEEDKEATKKKTKFKKLSLVFLQKY